MSEQAPYDVVVNQHQIARILNITTPTVREYFKRGMPCRQIGSRGVAWSFSVADCVGWIRDRDRADSVADPTTYDEARTRKESATAMLAEIELAKARGLIVEVEAVSTMLDDMFADVRAKLLSLGSKLAPIVYGSESLVETRKMIDDGINDALSGLSGAYDEAPEAGDTEVCAEGSEATAEAVG